MITRIISGLILAALLVFALVCLPQSVILWVVAAVAAVALYEFYKANFGKGKILIKLVGYIMGFGLLLLPSEYNSALLTFGMIGALVLTVAAYKKINFKDAAEAFFGAIYIFGFLKYIYLIRGGEGGKFLVFAVFIGAFATDIGAYFTGMLFGKHKLTEISPKKTVEGAFGGAAVTVLAFGLFGFVGTHFFAYGVNVLNLVVSAVVLAIISEFGDLAASVIKREVAIKDYGHLIPGHGGILDRIDSVLFTAPIFYYLNIILPIFVIK